jgi:hypothetical protein
MEKGHQHHIIFVDDNYETRNKSLTTYISSTDRLLWIDYSVAFDTNTIATIVAPFEPGCHGVIFPAIKPDTLNWNTFSEKIKSETVTEPLHQYAFEFDTVLNKKIKDNLYSIKETDPKCFCLDSKHIYKSLRNKKGETQKIPYSFSEFFDSLIKKGVKVYAFTDCELILTHPHECFGNILNCAGIQANT